MRTASVLLLLALFPAFVSVHLPISAPPEAVLVVLANTDLAPGRPIAPTDVTVVRMPAAYAHPGAVRGLDGAIGRVPHERILVGEAVLSDRLADAATAKGSAALIPSGMRGVVVQPDSVAGLREVAPGTRVDLLHTEAHGVPVTLMQDVEVLTIGHESNGTPWYVLSVTPHEAEAIARARVTGQLAFTVRAARRGNRAEAG